VKMCIGASCVLMNQAEMQIGLLRIRDGLPVAVGSIQATVEDIVGTVRPFTPQSTIERVKGILNA